MPEYRIKWALHRDTGTPGRFEVEFKNTTEAEKDEALFRMCRAGAEAQRKNPKITPRFSIVPSEIRKVDNYMAANYPEVLYQMEYPTGGNS